MGYCKTDLSEALNMKCPFCGETLIEGNLVCPNCRSLAIDFDYFENMDKMEEKYSKYSLSDLSKEKLTFDELITIFTSLKEQTILVVTASFLTNAGRMEHSPIFL